MKLDNCIEKTCCIYASDWHLAVMLLPFISERLKEENEIFMEFEESIEDKINQLLAKLKLKNEKEVRDISWNYKVGEEEYTGQNKIFIVSGSDDFIKKTNKKIEQFYNKREGKVEIIDCFHITENNSQKDFFDTAGFKSILTTSGRKNM